MRTWLRMGTPMVVAAGLIAVGVSAASHEASSPGAGGTSAPPGFGSAMQLVRYSTCADLLSGLRDHAAASAAKSSSVVAEGAQLPKAAAGAAAGAAEGGAAPVPAGAPMGASAPQYSTTTIHEAGADEPDIVKTDGRRVVTVSHGELRVVDTATRKLTESVSVGAEQWAGPVNLFLSGDRALVILPNAYPVPRMGPTGMPQPQQPQTRFVLVDLASGRVLGGETVSGSFLDARLVGSTARLVTQTQPEIMYPQNPKQIPSVVRATPLSAWLPEYRITAGGRTVEGAVDCGQVSHPRDYTGTSMLTIYSVDLARGLGGITPVSIVADGDTVYGTTQSLYVTSNPDWPVAIPAIGEVAPAPAGVNVQGGAAAPGQVAPGAGSAASPMPSGPVKVPPVPPVPPVPVPPVPVPAQQTEIHRFDISGSGPPRYVGSGSVPGQLLNQYSLSEYGGYLRVATTSGLYGASQRSAVYELHADTLKRAGAVSGLGQGQQIYSVRFIGAVGYVVTFRQVDPLYTLDLSDPAHPRVAGQLELTGFSSYLAPAGDGRLIGVGQEANAQGEVTGLLVALFDVHDPAHPTRLAHLVEPGEQSAAQNDPHAFLYWPATGTVVLPTTSWADGYYTAGARVLHVSGSSISPEGTIAAPADTGMGISRAMMIGSDLWTLSDAGLQVNSAATLAQVSRIALS